MTYKPGEFIYMPDKKIDELVIRSLLRDATYSFYAYAGSPCEIEDCTKEAIGDFAINAGAYECDDRIGLCEEHRQVIYTRLGHVGEGLK